jgi:hypothetical protein
MLQCIRQCIRKTDPPVEGYPLYTGGSGFVAHVAGRTCFFTAKHVFADQDGQIDKNRMRRVLVVKGWGDPSGQNLSFEDSFFPCIPATAGSVQILNDVLMLSCHRRPENETDDGFLVFNDDQRAADPAYRSTHALWIYGFPNVAGTAPIDYERKVYRPNRVAVKARFEHFDERGHIGVAQVIHAFSDDGEPFPMVLPPDGMSGSVVLEEDPLDGRLAWAGMLISGGNNTIRFITIRFLIDFAVKVVRERRAVSKW